VAPGVDILLDFQATTTMQKVFNKTIFLGAYSHYRPYYNTHCWKIATILKKKDAQIFLAE
jgi:hypothetical protein